LKKISNAMRKLAAGEQPAGGAGMDKEVEAALQPAGHAKAAADAVRAALEAVAVVRDDGPKKRRRNEGASTGKGKGKGSGKGRGKGKGKGKGG
jgi:hypothetical protein